MRKFFLIAFCLCISVVTNAQTKSDAMLFGDVKSLTTQKHIPYATIVVKNTNMGTSADGSGHFKLANLPLGKCLIVAHAMGYKSKEMEVEMKAGQVVSLFFELDEDLLNLEQLVVTATRTEHYIKDVPVRTEVITAKALENKNATNLFQALEGTPGVRVENQCQYCNFTMVRMQGLGAEHTQVLINGQPMYSGLAGIYGLQQLSTVDIGKIEVVKGAGSALYGSGAVAGAINIVTKEPSYEPSTTLDIQLGSYGTNKYDISSSMRNEKGNMGVVIFAQRYTEDAIDETGPGFTKKEVKKKDGISDRVMTNLTNAGFGLYFDNLLVKGDKLVVRGKSVFEKREGGTMTDDYFRNPLTDGTEGITTDRYEASLNYTIKIKKRSELNFSFGYVNHKRNATNDSFLGDYMSTHNDSVPDVRSMRPYLASENSYTSTLSFATRLTNHNLIAGIQGFCDKLEESGMYVVVDETSRYLGQSYRSVADKNAREFGLFLQDEWTIGEKFMVVPGIRFDSHYSSEEYTSNKQVSSINDFPRSTFNQTAVNPRIAIKYDLNKRVTFRLNAGTGFRAPYGFSEDLHLCSGSPRVWKSSDLNPERSFSYNFSTDYYGKRVRISANLFRTDLRDKIGFVDAEASVSALGYDYQWKNIDDAFVQGIELSLMSNLAKDLDLGADFTYNNGEYKHAREDWVGTIYESDSKYISRFPITTGSVRVEYTPESWSFVIIGNYQGKMYIDYYNSEVDPLYGDLTKIKKTDGFALLNARASKSLGKFKLYGGVNNIFDFVQEERHLDDAAFMYGPVYGRTFYVGLTINL
ncbi:MAG: TonB-dependent receptor [Rikenellaceae bacterium]|nr:TonB-dependent receptor [Rikenellaceae bacterium]